VEQYRRKLKTPVVAIRLDLDTDGITYRKWGGTQTGKRGDWLINNQGDVYTVDADTFAKTYRMVSTGVYEKDSPVWAERAEKSGTIQTKEGATAYSEGDYLVFNDPGRQDGYAVKAETFDSLYEAI
jgi:hypothetical protein